MISQKNKEMLERQQYRLAGKHSVVKVCEWTKKSLLDEGECYKEKFYGIKSAGCCENSPSAAWCDNKCLHCWRAIEYTQGDKLPQNIDEPEQIITELVEQRKKLLTGFKGNPKVNMEKFIESQEPTHFAISLIGEPTLYPKLGELVSLLRKQSKTSFVVTNGLHPEIIKKLAGKKQLPTQLYLSLNAPNKEVYDAWHNSNMKDAWNKFNETLILFSKLKGKTRTVLRMTLVRRKNMLPHQIKEYAELIKKSKCDFVEVKGFMSVGYSRKRLGYETMPIWAEIKDYAKLLAKALGKSYKILGKHKFSRIVLLGKSKSSMKIRKNEI